MPKRARISSQKSVVSSQTAEPESQVTEVHHEVEVMMQKMLENLLTAQEAAELLGVTDNHIRLLIQRKRISAVKKGKEWIVYKPSLKKYLNSKSAKGQPSSNEPKI